MSCTAWSQMTLIDGVLRYEHDRLFQDSEEFAPRIEAMLRAAKLLAMPGSSGPDAQPAPSRAARLLQNLAEEPSPRVRAQNLAMLLLEHPKTPERSEGLELLGVRASAGPMSAKEEQMHLQELDSGDGSAPGRVLASAYALGRWGSLDAVGRLDRWKEGLESGSLTLRVVERALSEAPGRAS